MFVLPAQSEPAFPEPARASPEGLLAIGGDLSTTRLLAAYRAGIFPWYNPGQPILWWSPDPRTVLFPDRLHVSHSLQKTIRKACFSVTMDTAFAKVIDGCAARRPRHPEDGTWITPEMREAYLRLYQLGYAHSVEAWHDRRLAGGLYGVALGKVFFGESMFSIEPNASKVAFAHLVTQLRSWDYRVIDCQVHSDHLESLGAEDISRTHFLSLLAEGLMHPTVSEPWRLDPTMVIWNEH